MMNPLINILDGIHSIEIIKQRITCRRTLPNLTFLIQNINLKRAITWNTFDHSAQHEVASWRQVPVFQSSYRGLSHMRTGQESK
jgi:hypothetical protein